MPPTIDPTHELLRGNRVFLYPDSVAGNVSGLGWVQINPLWAFRTYNGLDGVTDWGWNQGAHPSIRVGAHAPSGTPASYFSYWEDVWPDDGSKDFTIIARARYEGTDPGGGGGSFIAGARDGTNGGFLFGVWDAGGTDEGLALFMYDGAGHTWVATDQDGISSMIGTPHVYAAVYRSAEREISFYRSGMMTRRVVNASWDWNPRVTTSNKQLAVGRADSGFIFPGDIGWLMIFAEAKSDAEIMALTRDDEWPFVWPETLFLLEDAEGIYTTTVTVGSTLIPSTAGAVTYVTEVDAEAVVAGDFDIEPEAPATGNYVTMVGVGNVAYYDSPEFGVFITQVGVNSTITATAPVRFVTTVGVTSQERGLVDGRADLIDTDRYDR